MVFLFNSIDAFAAKPTSITFQGEQISTVGQGYSLYVVRCSNNDVKKISAWDKRKTWCVGESQSDFCTRKQIKAAKIACK